MNATKIEFATQNGQTLTVVSDGTTVTLRIAKDGHNRGIAKISAADGEAVSRFLAPLKGRKHG